VDVELDREIAGLLLPWYEKNKRSLPWRADREPYHVWLSEVMCQQTRVEAVKGYYHRFLTALPTIEDLAVCPEEQLSKLWEGLGYYSRARNLKRSAEIICREYGGVFPSDFAAIRALPGIGDYTAAAIASICFDLPCPVVDGNVLRVVTRLRAFRGDIRRERTKAEVRQALAPLFDGVSSGALNQALMELGALVCQPNRAPDCGVCPLQKLCSSSAGLWREIPFKSELKERRVERHTVFLLCCGGAWALRKRPKKGLLAGLWEFPNLPGDLEAQAALDAAAAWNCRPIRLLRHTEKRHIFTHILWELPAWVIECQNPADGFIWASSEEIKERYSLPTAFRQFMNETEIKENPYEKSD
jgi:A/G-specific adenine glycosylase